MLLSGAQKIGVVAVAMIVVAEGAVLLLKPREDVLEPVPVVESEYFGEVEIARGRDYREGQRWLFIGGLAVQGALLGALASGRPGSARRLLERAGERPVLGAAAAGAGLSLALGLVALPTDVWAHERAVDYEISVQSLDSWLADAGKSALIGAVIAAGGAALLIALIRRAPRVWPLPGAAAVVAGVAALTWLSPVVLAPLFNEFDPLPEGSQLRSEVLELADRAGVDVGEVYAVDASKRSSAINAYVGGLGPTKRVVLHDTLIDGSERGELRAVVAHELSHVANRDVPRGIAFVALIAPFGLFFVREAGGGLAARFGADAASPAALPAYALALGVASFVLSVPGNQLSRSVERVADDFALELTRDPQSVMQLHKDLAVTNVADPDPPAWARFLFGSHPPAVDRIGMAVAFEQQADQASG